jgi:hypothetical protein
MAELKRPMDGLERVSDMAFQFPLLPSQCDGDSCLSDEANPINLAKSRYTLVYFSMYTCVYPPSS